VSAVLAATQAALSAAATRHRIRPSRYLRACSATRALVVRLEAPGADRETHLLEQPGVGTVVAHPLCRSALRLADIAADSGRRRPGAVTSEAHRNVTTRL
jgi:hypothetical protein